MSQPLRPVTRARLFEQVVERLRELVAAEELGPGDRLPPERDLATRLGVSRTSVRQAILALEVQGLVDVRHGGGTFLLRDWRDVESIGDLLDRKERLPDILDARDALEGKLAALAAERRTKADLRSIRDALGAMREALDRGELGVGEDERFHGAVVLAARSPLLARFMAEIAPAIAESRRESLRQPDRPEQSWEQHRRIADAIERSDPEAASALMREHVRSVGAVKLLDWPNDD